MYSVLLKGVGPIGDSFPTPLDAWRLMITLAIRNNRRGQFNTMSRYLIVDDTTGEVVVG